MSALAISPQLKKATGLPEKTVTRSGGDNFRIDLARDRCGFVNRLPVVPSIRLLLLTLGASCLDNPQQPKRFVTLHLTVELIEA